MPTNLEDWAKSIDSSQLASQDKYKSAPDQRQMTFGEKLVGLNFNPSNDTAVDKAKRLCAELADLVNDYRNQPRESSALEAQLYNHTIGEILNAQMNVVKLLTLKY